MQRLIVLTVTALLAASPAPAKPMKWMDGTAVGLPKGSEVAVVKGDPAKAGDFIVRLKFPADFAVPPHSHPGDEVVRVVSGGPLHYGMGDKLDMANSGSLEKGYHVTLEAKMNHWAATTAPTEIEVSAMGPFAITYANPADDPRK